MGFSKKTNEPDIAIEVRHPWHPGDVYTFYFPKRLPQAALAAEAKFLGLKDDERPDEYRKELINMVAEMVTREPEGFDDFPGAAQVAQLKANAEKLAGELKEDDRRQLQEANAVLESELALVRNQPLPARFAEYFDDPNQVEFEAIIAGVWRAYRASSVPSAYMKSLPVDGEGSGSVSRGAAQTQSGV